MYTHMHAPSPSQSMRVCGYSPEVVGLENLDELRKTKKNCLFVPNHASFLDILTLTGFIPMPMKCVCFALDRCACVLL